MTKLRDEPLFAPKNKWMLEVERIRLVIYTPNHCTWWFRFWCTFFFGAKWTKLDD